jgi:methylase of polypeptide subunit release factors
LVTGQLDARRRACGEHLGTARETLDDPDETEFFAKLVGRAVKVLGASSVLDVGCGAGRPTLAAAQAGARYVLGIDVVERNVALTRRAARETGLTDRVSAHHASFHDLVRGKLTVPRFDLLVSNPPYVPGGEGTAVDGGASGRALIDPLLEQAPALADGVALLFGSLCDPRPILQKMLEQGFVIVEAMSQWVPFGRYTSQPQTLARLRELRAQGRAFFRDVPSAEHPRHAYLTIGLLAKTGSKTQALVNHALMRAALMCELNGDEPPRKPGHGRRQPS